MSPRSDPNVPGLDDAISGVVIRGNRFAFCGEGRNGFGAVQIHGGKDNLIEGNTFEDCTSAISFTTWSTNRWVDFVSGRLDRGDIDKALYLKRYPALAELEQHPNRNTVRSNRFVRCEEVFRRHHGEVIGEGNIVIP
jgi:hypothetical protein